jgi:hypothetical protein
MYRRRLWPTLLPLLLLPLIAPTALRSQQPTEQVQVLWGWSTTANAQSAFTRSNR